MRERAAVGLRGARASAFAVAALALGVSAHVAAGGSPPRVNVLVPTFLIIAALGVAVAGRERSGWSIGAVTAGVQAGLHVVLDAHVPGAGPATAAAVMHHHTAGTVMSSMSPPPAAPAHAMHGGPGMIAAHLLAAAALTWWLRRGERLLWQGLRTFALRIRSRVVVPLAVPAPALPHLPVRTSLPTSRLRTGTVRRRGPPAALPI